MKTRLFVAGSLAILVSGRASANPQYNGTELGGTSLPQFHQQNGTSLVDGTNGISLSGVQVSSAVVNGQALSGPLTNVQLNGTMLTGTINGVNVTAQQLVGATLTANVLYQSGDTMPVTLRINSMQLPDYWVTKCGPLHCGKPIAGEPNCWQNCDTTNQPGAATAPNKDVNLYQVVYLEPNTQTWAPICQDPSGALNPDGTPKAWVDLDGYSNLSIPVHGAWETQVGTNFRAPNGQSYSGGDVIPGSDVVGSANEAFAFGCRDLGAIAKCVERNGYKYWRNTTTPSAACMAVVPSSQQGAVCESLDPVFLSCTRMLRADYCGDGVSHTVDGTSIDVSDIDSIQTLDNNGYGYEANWSQSGSVCLSQTRYTSLMPLPLYNSACANSSGGVVAGCPGICGGPHAATPTLLPAGICYQTPLQYVNAVCPDKLPMIMPPGIGCAVPAPGYFTTNNSSTIPAQ